MRGLGKKNNKLNKLCGVGFGDIPTVDFGSSIQIFQVTSLSSYCITVSLQTTTLPCFRWVITAAFKIYCSHCTTKTPQTLFQNAKALLWSRSPNCPPPHISSLAFHTTTWSMTTVLTTTTRRQRNERHARRAFTHFQRSAGRHCRPSTSSTMMPS